MLENALEIDPICQRWAASTGRIPARSASPEISTRSVVVRSVTTSATPGMRRLTCHPCTQRLTSSSRVLHVSPSVVVGAKADAVECPEHL